MNHVLLTSSPLDVTSAQSLVSSPSCGAISIFIGTTRNNFKGKGVLQLEYEAYQSMAEKQMTQICLEIRDKWPQVENIALQHRLGVVPISESSVIVAVSSPHRQDSLEAVQFGIDAIKAKVPIWKKEVYDDGSTSWKENCECTWNQSV